ncbi:MAG TPA: GNAT family N-acetyltransferase [Mycobacterium sp.]|nr:GNAT family N-acetyltransferase [Mycobacterium sp.]
MRQSDIVIRRTVAGDLEDIDRIYAHHVQTGVATFELTAPDAAEWHRRLDAVIAAGLPFLTATRYGRVAGYAYCAPWKTRPAYRHTVEDSVYVAPDAVGCGIGGRLLDALLNDCTRAGVREVIAVIVDADGAASLALHRNRGFVDAGRLTAVGFKHGRWLDTVLLQRSLS